MFVVTGMHLSCKDILKYHDQEVVYSHDSCASISRVCISCLESGYYRMQGLQLGKTFADFTSSEACSLASTRVKCARQTSRIDNSVKIFTLVLASLLCPAAKGVVSSAIGSYHLVYMCNQRQGS